MNTLVDGLILAVRSLPKADKATVVEHLWEDLEFRAAIADLLRRSMLGPRRNASASTLQDLATLGVDLTPRERGKRLRENYLRELHKKGISINQVDGVWAKTANGSWIAIPVATERRPDRWFLGLGQNDVLERIDKRDGIVVLLCQSESGSTLDFVIPTPKIQEIVGSLSRSKGQLKFNLTRVGNRYHLIMAGRGRVDISDFLGSVSSFESSK